MKELTETKKLIEKGWTQHAFARNKNGKPVNADNKEARSWSLAGALMATTNFDDKYSLYLEMKARIVAEIKKKYNAANGEHVYIISTWNNDRRRIKEDVIEILDLAIKEANK